MESVNEKKAKEIAQSVSFFWTNEDDSEKSIIDAVSLRKAIFNGALQAMQWKDEQILLDDDDKLATEVKVDGITITPPQGYLIGKVTHVKDSLIVEFKKH